MDCSKVKVKSKEQEIVGPNESSCAGVHGERDEFKLDMMAEISWNHDDANYYRKEHV